MRCGGSCSVRDTEVTCPSISRSISAGDFSSSQRPSILLSTTKRPARCAGLMRSRQTSMSVRVTPASAARTNSTACALGIRFSVSSGSAPIAFSPGVSITTSPVSSSGCGMLTSAWRQHDTSIMSASSGAMGEDASSASNRPISIASSTGTRLVSRTHSKASFRLSTFVGSIGTVRHSSGALRRSATDTSRSRVSMGSSRMPGGSAGSQRSSVGHIVVRPADEGSTRWP